MHFLFDLMDRLHYSQTFKKYWNIKIHYHSIEEHPKFSKIAKVWLQNVVKCEKFGRVKFANFVYFCITYGKLIPFSP